MGTALRRNAVAAEDAPVEGVLAGVALIVLVGAFVGNLYASKRRARPHVSIYDVIARRLETERKRRGDEG